jgi:hypothetical protein
VEVEPEMALEVSGNGLEAIWCPGAGSGKHGREGISLQKLS